MTLALSLWVASCTAVAFWLNKPAIALLLACLWALSLLVSARWGLRRSVPTPPCPYYDPCLTSAGWLATDGDLLIVSSNDTKSPLILLAGPGFQREAGWEEGDLLGHSWVDVIHPDDVPNILSQRGLHSSNTTITYTTRWRHKEPLSDGSIQWVSLDWSLLSVSRLSLVHAHIMNMTSHFQWEAQMSTWAMITSDLMSIVDMSVPGAARRFEWVNEAWSRNLGWSHSELYTMEIQDILDPKDINQILPSPQGGLPFPLEVARAECPARCNGDPPQYKNYEWLSVTLNGKLYTSGRNIDAEVSNRRALERTIQDLKAVNTDLERFASVTAHQLRSPPRTIAGIAQALLEDYGHLLDASGLQFLDDIRSDADQMAEIVDGLYRFSKVRTSGDLVLEPIDIDAVLADIRSMGVKHEIMSEGDILQWDEGFPKVKGDRVLLLEVFRNLVENGFKFNSSTPKKMYVSAEIQGNGRCVITVKDNGIGIDPRYKGKIFDMFQRLHSGYKGTGVGLALVAAIIEKMGGTISVESVVDGGSTFTFDLEVA